MSSENASVIETPLEECSSEFLISVLYPLPNTSYHLLNTLANTQWVYDSDSLSHIASATCVENVSDNAFIVQNQVQIKNGLNPLAPCFRPLSMVSSNEKFIRSTLNPNAPIFSIGDLISIETTPNMQNENNTAENLNTTPLVLEIGTPDVSSDNVMFDDDQESFISDTESSSELREPVPNPDDSNLDQESPKNVLASLRQKNVDRIIIGHLNINSIRNKIIG